MSTVPLLKPCRRRTTSSSLLTLYQRFLRYLRRLLSARRDVSYDEYDHHPPRYRPQRINALCRLTSFSKSEIKLIYQGFKQVCPTGVVNENTFKDIFSSYFPQDATMYAHYVFKACDQQNNGTINFQEFLTGLSMLTRGPTVDKLKWTFRLYDLNGDGRIDREEIREIISSIYLMLGRHTEPSVEHDTPAQHADKVFERLDQNQDGYVTFDEFLECCQKDENVILSMQLLDTVL
ncbi:calsenilin-like isoform X2 [Argiope bruennichi]|uniref:calsenilin-like isoform X2 n=1 Tax=Argiope bruennichi TaxID=94029 RepID=UPI002495260F|nr:calsenilin-like isoform X2 [Argiope bruennichi]